MKKFTLNSIAEMVILFVLTISFTQCNLLTTDQNAAKPKEADTTITTIITETTSDTTLTTKNVPDTTVNIETLAEKDVTPAALPTTKTTTTVITKIETKSSTEKKPIQVDIPKTTQSSNPVTTTATETKTEKKVTPAEVPVITSDFVLKSMSAVVRGTSTLHAWESQVTKIEGKGSIQLKDNVVLTLKNVDIKIAVEGIKSKEGKKMDNKTYETFNADKNPFILYSFSTAQVKTNASNSVTVEASGNLTMAGVTKSVLVSGAGKELPNGDLQLSVTKKIKMTDFNMIPPVMMLGTIKVGDEITFIIDFVLTKVK